MIGFRVQGLGFGILGVLSKGPLTGYTFEFEVL